MQSTTSTDSAIRVLLVEDDPAVMEVHSMMLQHFGAEVIAATNSEEALARCEGVQLVLMDVHLKGDMDGIALTGALRADGVSAPIVGVTGGLPDRAHSFDHVELKPVSLARFQALLARVGNWERQG